MDTYQGNFSFLKATCLGNILHSTLFDLKCNWTFDISMITTVDLRRCFVKQCLTLYLASCCWRTRTLEFKTYLLCSVFGSNHQAIVLSLPHIDYYIIHLYISLKLFSSILLLSFLFIFDLAHRWVIVKIDRSTYWCRCTLKRTYKPPLLGFLYHF